jgi:hypothetical protein
MPLQALFYSFRTAVKTRKLAQTLFPEEKWVKVEPHIWVAVFRMDERTREPDKWEREMAQVRILTSRGSVAYFLPEKSMPGGSGKRSADLVLDGVILEMKTTEGTRTTLGGKFRLAYKQGLALLEGHSGIKEHSVFIRVLSDLKPGSVKAKIAGELKNRTDQGSFICFFEHTGELFNWTYKELKAIIST